MSSTERLIRIVSSGHGRVRITMNPGIISRKVAQQTLSRAVCSHRPS